MSIAAPPSPVAGWQEFIESLAGLPKRLLAKLPEKRRREALQQRPLW